MANTRNLIANLLLLITFLAISLVAAEITVRWIVPQSINPRFMTDSGFGNRVPAANKQYKHSVPGEYSILITTNSFGGRGSSEYNKKPAEGVTRLCVLGDSFAFGYGVNDNEVVSYVLEERLNISAAQPEAAFQVLNFGVSGYGQAEQLTLYRNRVSEFDCEKVILFYFSNDLGNNIVSGLFEIDDGGSLVRKNSEYLPGVRTQELLYGMPFLGDALAQSHMWSILRNIVSKQIHNRMLREKGLKSYEGAADTSNDLTIGLIRQLNIEITQSGSEILIFVIPNRAIESNFPFSEILESGIEIIDGRKLVSPVDYYEKDSHWKPSGHEKAAKAILERMAIQ